MAKAFKVFISLLLIFIIVLVGVYFFVSFYFTPHRLKAIVGPRLSERLGREVTVKDIHFNLFKGLEVKKLAVKGRPGLASERFILCDNLILKYKFWPLLRGRIEIGSLVLERPFIEIVKDKKGNFNFADIAARFKKEKQKGKPTQPSAKVKKKTALTFFISEVAIKDGEVLFKNLQTDRKIHLTHFNLRASHIGLDHTFPLDLSTLVNEFAVKIDGEINPQTLTASLQVKASGDNFSSLMTFFPPTLKTLTGKANLDMNLTAAGLEKVQFKGVLSGWDFHVVLRSGQKFVHLNPIISYTGRWDGKTQRLTLEDIKVSLNGFSAKAQGFIEKKMAEVEFNIPLQSPSPLMALSSQPLPLEITQGKLAAKGEISTDDMVIFAGKLKLILANIGLKTKNQDYTGLNIKFNTAFNYNLSANELILHKGIIDFNKTKLNLGGKITSNWLNLRCKAPRIALSDFHPFLPPALGISSLKGEMIVDAVLAGNLATHKLNAKGKISIQGVGGNLNNQLVFSNWQGEILLDKQDFVIPSLKGKVNETTLKLNGKLMHLLNQPFFNLNIEASNVNIEKLTALSFVSAETAKEKRTNTENVAKAQKLPSKTKPQVEPKPLNFPFSASGQIKVKKLFYKQLVFSFLNAKYNLSQNILSLKPIQGQLEKGGTINGDVEINLGKKGFVYKVNLELDKIDMNNISFLIPHSVGSIQGEGSLNAYLKGKGITPPSLEKYLNAQLHLVLANGEFSGNPIWQGIANFLDIDALANPKFKAFNTNMKVESGKININGKVNEKDYGLALKGQATIMGKLDLRAQVRLNPSLVQHSKAKQLFGVIPKSKDGDYLVPLQISGKINSPKLNLDKKVIKKVIKEKAKEKLERVLKKKIPLKDIPFFK